MDSIQAEVSKEASPLLDFLIKHAAKLVAGLVALIVLIAGAGIWKYYTGKTHRETREKLGLILIAPSSEDKIARLETFIAGAPDDLKRAAWLALMETAGQIGNHEKAAQAWARFESGSKAADLVAKIGEAQSLSVAGKHAESLALLEKLLESSQPEASAVINDLIIVEAESLGQWGRALEACESVLGGASAYVNQNEWKLRADYFRQKATTAAAPDKP
jgi:tetratricopeptide (TPR) repeat protein